MFHEEKERKEKRKWLIIPTNTTVAKTRKVWQRLELKAMVISEVHQTYAATEKVVDI